MTSSKSGQNIVTAGGGTGLPLLNESLFLAGANYIKSVVTVMDSGGATGRRRTDSFGQEIAFSDGMRTLLSLARPQNDIQQKQIEALTTILKSRNTRDQVLGQDIFAHFFNQASGFERTQQLLEQLMNFNLSGKVIPITLKSTYIAFKTEHGLTFQGEDQLDNQRTYQDKVTKIWLKPEVEINPDARDAIENAGLIILAFGSWNGSTKVNFLPRGAKEALKRTRAKRIYVSNLASTRNETDNFTPFDFESELQEITGLRHPLDYIIIPSISRRQFEAEHPDVAARYQIEQSRFLGWTEEEIQAARGKSQVKIIRHNATLIDKLENRIRHDPKKLAEALKKILY